MKPSLATLLCGTTCFLFCFSAFSQSTQTISFDPIAAKTFGDSPFTVSASASSGLAVTFISSNTSVATVSGDVVSIVGSGTTTISALQLGDENYASTSEQQTLMVAKADQTITFPAITDHSFGDPAFDLDAVTTSGLPITYSSSNPSVADVNGGTLVIKGEGSVTIIASALGDGNYNAASPVQGSFVVSSASYSSGLAKLVKDIEKQSERPSMFWSSAEVNGKLIMSLKDEKYGEEIWVTEHIRSPFVLLKDIMPGGSGSQPKEFAVVGNFVFFAASDSISYRHSLWKSDGTPSGTTKVDLPYRNIFIRTVRKFKDGLFIKLLKDDKEVFLFTKGSPETTVTLGYIQGNNGGFSPDVIIEVGENIFFRADDQSGAALWKTDGTSTGTKKVEFGMPYLETAFNNKLYYWNGVQRSIDGASSTSTSLGDYYMASTLAVGNILYYVQNTSQGSEFRSLSVVGNNTFIKAATDIRILGVIKNKILLNVLAAQNGNNELWLFDTATNQISFYRSLTVNGINYRADQGTVVENRLFVTAVGFPNFAVWSTDGADDFRLHGIYLSKFVNVVTHGLNNLLVAWGSVSGTVAYGMSYFDAESNDTGEVETSSVNVGSDPRSYVVFDNELYFVAKYSELWKSRGDEQSTISLNLPVTGYPVSVATNNSLLFGSTNSTYGNEIWRYNKTDGASLLVDVNPGAAGSYPRQMISFNDKAFFWGEGSNGSELWSSDGTSVGTVKIKDIGSPYGAVAKTANNFYYLTSSYSYNNPKMIIVKSDGTTSGTFTVAEFSDIRSSLVSVGNYVYFIAIQTNSTELWKISVNDNAISRVKTFSASAGYYSSDLVEFQGEIVFNYADPQYGMELWISDGTESGTHLLKDIYPGTNDSQPGGFTKFQDRLYFVANDGSHGDELWSTKGTSESTMMTADLTPGAGGSSPQQLYVTHDRLIFWTESALWEMLPKSQTPSQVNTGVSFDMIYGPREFFEYNDLVFFSGNTAEFGNELWVLDFRTPSNNTVTFAVANKTYGDPDFTLEATSSSGQPVVFKSLDPSVITVTGNIASIKGKGTVKLIATEIGDSQTKPASSDVVVTVFGLDQTITFGLNSPVQFSDVVISPGATSTSNLPVLYSSSNNDVAIIENQKIKLVNVGGVTITARQPGNKSYNAANEVTQSLVVGKGNQQITFAPIANKILGTVPFILSATSSSGLSVSFSSSNESIAKVRHDTVFLLQAGSVTINASQQGNNNYNPANNVSRPLTVAKGTPIINFNALQSKTFGDGQFSLSASSTVNLPMIYTSSDPAIASVSGNKISINGAGSAMITATQEANENYNSATSSQLLVINKANQSITIDGISDKAFGDAPFKISARSSSDLPLIFKSSDLSKAVVHTDSVTITGAGTVSIIAVQEGNQNYNSKEVSESITIRKADQAITFNAISAKTFGDVAFDVSAVSSSGLPITFSSADLTKATVSGQAITITGAGLATITASQAGNLNYNPAESVSKSFAVSKASQVITFESITDKTIVDDPFDLVGKSTSGLPITFTVQNPNIATVTGNVVNVLDVGVSDIQASQPGNNNYVAAENVIRSLVVVKGKQTISFSPISPKVMGQGSFKITATASSNLPVSFSVSSDRINIVGSDVTINKPGHATIKAAQAGNSRYFAAETVDQTFCIAPEKPLITVSDFQSGTPTLTSSNDTGNQWFRNGNQINNAEKTLVARASGIYTVKTIIDGCESLLSEGVDLIVTSIEEPQIFELSVYPNPSKENIVVEISAESTEASTIAVLNALGKIQKVVQAFGTSSTLLNLNDLSDGLYIVRVQINNEIKVKTFVLAR
jgi:ELWxxDGT repeat protein